MPADALDDSGSTLRSKALRALERSPYEPYTGSTEAPRRSVSSEPLAPGYSGRMAAAIVGMSSRQLDYWARTDLIRPSLVAEGGGGSRRLYSYRDLIELKVVKALLGAGNRLETVREAFQGVRDHLGEDLSSTKLVIAGASAVPVHDPHELRDVLDHYKGEGVINVLDLAKVKEDVDAVLVEMLPEGLGRA